jgi:hypothetical protein
MQIEIQKEDIFNYIVGNTDYDPIEKIIDPTRYEVFDCGIYDHVEKIMLAQEEDYNHFASQVSRLRSSASKMHRKEIDQICLELEEIAPTNILLQENNF